MDQRNTGVLAQDTNQSCEHSIADCRDALERIGFARKANCGTKSALSQLVRNCDYGGNVFELSAAGRDVESA